MLSHEEICCAVARIALTFPVKRASYCGSYAEGRQTDESDLDLLVEFNDHAVSLLVLSAMKYDLEDMLKIPVDVIHAPIPADALIRIGRVIPIYGQ
jgi:predicted nucleotidyltransferase